MVARFQKYGSHNQAAAEFHHYWLDSQKRCRNRLPDHAVDYQALLQFREHGVTSWATEKSQLIAKTIHQRLLAEEAVDSQCWDESNRYNKHLVKSYPELEELFHDCIGGFLHAYFKTHYKIYYGLMYKSVYSSSAPRGSSIWHRDGGPGSCLNIMFSITPVNLANGALEVISNLHTADLIKKTNKQWRRQQNNAIVDDKAYHQQYRQAISNHVDSIIDNKCDSRPIQPTGEPGIIIPFLNNAFHRGGHAKEKTTRIVCIFHVYPSHTRADWTRYRDQGITKRSSFPTTPDEDF